MSVVQEKAQQIAAGIEGTPADQALPPGLWQTVLQILLSLLGSGGLGGCAGGVSAPQLAALAQRPRLFHRLWLRRHVRQQLADAAMDAALGDAVAAGIWRAGASLTEAEAAALLAEAS